MSIEDLEDKLPNRLPPLQYDSKLIVNATDLQGQIQQSYQIFNSHQKINVHVDEPTLVNHQQKKDRHLINYLDMHRLNPDWKFAEGHGSATKPGVFNPDQSEKCICCLKRLKTQPLPLCQNSKELEFLGHGFPLFYIFVKYAMIILLMQILNYSIMELYIAISENYSFCVEDHHKTIHGEEVLCTSFMVMFAKIGDQLTGIQLVLRITSFFTLLASLVYVRDVFTKTWMYYDERKKTYANFSIIIQHLPNKQEIKHSNLTIGQMLRQFFNDENIFENKPRIVKINLQGDLYEYLALEDKVKAASSELGTISRELYELNQGVINAKQIKKIQELTKRREEIQQEKLKAETELSKEKSNLKKQIEKQDLNCDKAIICFETEQQRIAVQKAFKKINKQQLFQHFTERGAEINLEKAPQPREINWRFLNVPESTRLKRRLLSWAVFILMLTALTVGIYFLFTYTSHKIETAEQAQQAAAIELGYIFGIVLFNKFILVYVIHHLVDFEMHRTGETFQFSLMLKYALGLFFTTAVIALLVEGAVRKNVFTEQYGIAEEETIMFFLITFFVPLVWLINPWYLVKLVKRKLDKDSIFLTQEEANALMQDPQYLMGKRYAEILQSFWFTFLYACLLPFGSILIFFWLGFYYWVDKYNLLRRSSISQGVSGDLCMKALFLLEFILVLKPSGEIIFDSLLRNQWHYFSLIELGLGTLYIGLPIGKFIKYFHPQRFLSTEVTYSELLEKQSRSYELYNPITKQDELKKVLELSEKNSMILSEVPNQSSQRLLLKKHRFMRPHYYSQINNSPSKAQNPALIKLQIDQDGNNIQEINVS